MKLLIVESPAKCSKIQGFLGAEWRVQATMGHIRCLKEGIESLDIGNWTPTYETIPAKAAAIKSLKAAAKGAEVYIGSDDDREGEAIGWHTCKVLGLDPAKTPRVIFHEITKEALTKAVASPTRINMHTVEAQQARSMLDMLIGFTLSPCLWKAVGYKPGLSAGRCQTPALRLVYDRDRVIEGHQIQISWVIRCEAILKWTSPDPYTEDAALKALSGVDPLLTITDRKDTVSKHKAPAVFITSSLQQEASSRLGMNPKITMQLAQKLYEGGHITYMRTDSAVMCEEATMAARALVETTYGAPYLSDSKGGEGSTHEGIRPTHFDVTEVDDSAQRLYSLIWKRAMQSVMAPHVEAVVKLVATCGSIKLCTETRETTFAGWTAVGMPVGEDDESAEEPVDVAAFQISKKVRWTGFQAVEARTSPPPRYTEASLIRELEKKGIGRPSTYATLIETVLDRGYVEKSTKAVTTTISVKGLTVAPGGTVKSTKTSQKVSTVEKGKLVSTSLGRTVIEWLLKTFDDLLAYDFTAKMESQLDNVATGTCLWKDPLSQTWSIYKDRYQEVMQGPQGSTVSGSGSKGVLGSDEAGLYKILVSKKGPLFVLEKEGEKTRFASVPTNLTVPKATLEDAKAAFAVVVATTLTTLDGIPVTQKSGKFGPYISWNGVSVPVKDDETLADLEARLREKMVALDHTVGPFKIKKGPYGLYMYRTGGTGKPTFVGLPEGTDYASLSVEGAEALYKANSKKKSK